MARPLAPLTLCPDYSKLSLTGDLSLPLDCELCEGRGQAGLSHQSPSPTRHWATPGAGRYAGFVAELTDHPAAPPLPHPPRPRNWKDTCAWSIMHLHSVKSVWGRLVRAFSRIWAVTVV